MEAQALDPTQNPDPAPSAPNPPTRMRRWLSKFNAVFLVTVLLPTLGAIGYFGFVASDVYISESRFVVRNPQRQTATGLGALLQSTGFSRSQDDTYSVHDFIRSRDALHELDEKLKVRAAFSDAKVDPISRFPGLDWDRSFEALHRHYLKYVGIEYDSASSISTLKVRAFTAADAKGINELLLQMGERLVNNLNTRSRQDLIAVAEHEVKVAEERAKAAATALSSFRSDRGVFDPDRQSALQLQAVAKLQEELQAAEAQLQQIMQVSPRNPQVATLSTRVEGLKRLVEKESAKVTGGGKSLSSKSPIFDRLVLDKSFAERQLAGAMSSMETARNEAARKQLYLERLVQPNLPDMAVEPRRIRSILMVFVVGLMLWAVMSLVIASIREHSA